MSIASDRTISPVGSVFLSLARLRDRLVLPWVPSSRAARIAPDLALGLATLALLLSPWLGTGLNALMVLVVAFATALWRICHPGSATAGRLGLPVALLFAAMLVATAGSPFLVASVKGLAKFAIYGLAYVSFRSLVARRPEARVLLPLALVLAALGETLLGLYQFRIKVAPLATWEDAESELHLTRVYGSLRNPNLMGAYLALAWPAAFAFALAGQRLLLRVTGWATLLLLPACLYVTYSRGAYLALALEGAILGGWWLWHARKATRLPPWLPALAALAGVAVVALLLWKLAPTLQARVASMTNVTGDSSNVFRTQVWRATLALIRDSWWIGVGVGNDAFRHAYALYMVSGFEALGAYNIFLEWWAEAGIVGLVAFLNLIRAGVRTAWHRTPAWPWAAAVTAAFAGLCLHGMVDTVFFRPSVQLGFWLWLALADQEGAAA